MIIVPKVSYSLLASYGKFADLKDALLAVSAIGIDLIHYDVSEQKTLAGGTPTCASSPSSPSTSTSASGPRPLIARTKMEPRDFFCIHVENARPLAELRRFREHLGCAFGLAINVDTPVEALEYAIPEISFVLFMAAVPGVSGGSFNESVIDKIQTFKMRHPKIRVHVDGGINNYSAALLRGIGINVMISGSYLLNDNNYSNQVARLVGQNLNLPLSDLMHAEADLPAVREDASIGEVAREIDAKGIGCTTIVGEGHRFLGLVTDTDIRASS
jgi:pentose-5-phosphate-3-epimerase